MLPPLPPPQPRSAPSPNPLPIGPRRGKNAGHSLELGAWKAIERRRPIESSDFKLVSPWVLSHLGIGVSQWPLRYLPMLT